MSNTPKSLMSYYLEGSIVSRELEQMMHQNAADARFDAELSGHEDRYELMHSIYAGTRRKKMDSRR